MVEELVERLRKHSDPRFSVSGFDAHEAAERITALEAENRRLLRQSTDRQYFIDALVMMLGPNGLAVWEGWQASGVQRVHHSWGPDAAAMTGEERAAAILAFEAAPKTLIHDVDAEIARTALEGKEQGHDTE